MAHDIRDQPTVRGDRPATRPFFTPRHSHGHRTVRREYDRQEPVGPATDDRLGQRPRIAGLCWWRHAALWHESILDRRELGMSLCGFDSFVRADGSGSDLHDFGG